MNGTNQSNSDESMTRLLRDVREGSENLKRDVEWVVRTARGAGLIILHGLAITVEVLIRYDFGERYLNIGRIVLGVLFLMAVQTVGYAVYGIDVSTMTAPLLVAYLIGCVAQLALIGARKRRGERWHSRSSGVSLLTLVPAPWLTSWRVQSTVEPVSVALVGLVLWSFNWMIGGYLVLAGAAIAGHAAIEARAFRGKLLDRIDAQIESEAITAALEGTPPQQASGFVVPGGVALAQDSANYARAVEALDPTLRELVESKPSAVGRADVFDATGVEPAATPPPTEGDPPRPTPSA